MPFYEVTLMTRSLSKSDLVKALTRAGRTLLSHGAVIEKVESLGHRDLPFRRITKQTNESVYATNYFLFHTHLSPSAKDASFSVLRHDLDTIHVGVVQIPEESPKAIDCNLEEILKPPAQRIAVKELRENQKMGHFTRQMIYKRTEKEWKSIPKSYPIAPQRV